MANLTESQVTRLHTEGTNMRFAVYGLTKVSGSDIADLSQDFSTVVKAVAMTLVSQTGGSCTIPLATDPTVVIIPSGPSADVGWLMAWGAGH